jgi:hypothetical protein
MDHRPFCDALIQWANLREEAERAADPEAHRFSSAWSEVHLQIIKSCLLDRMLNGDEKPSATPCPVHKGRWSGIHWFGTRQIDGRWHRVSIRIKDGAEIVGEPEHDGLAEWRAAGCRCFMHKCGCTTGWQPDEHCGCVKGAE